jgi:hypothetical protein
MKRWIWILAITTSAFAAEPAGVGISLSAYSGLPAGFTKKDWADADAESYPTLGYAGKTQNGRLVITPTVTPVTRGKKKSDFLDLYRSGAMIYPIGSSTEMNVKFPALDVKLVNNGKKTVHFSSAVVKVAHSAPDPTPLPMVLGGDDRVQCMDVVNEGWDPIDSLKLEFGFTTALPKALPPEKLPYQRTFQRVKEDLRVELIDELSKSGVASELSVAAKNYLASKAAVRAMEANAVDLAKLDSDPAHKKAEQNKIDVYESMRKLDHKLAGPFRKNCWIHGRMTVSWKDGGETKTKTYPFYSEIAIFPPEGLGSPGPVAGKYEAMLRESGENYELPVDISRIVKPGGTDRFTLTLGIPRTSKHELTLELRTTEGETLSSGPVTIEGLLPRSAAEMLETPSSVAP